MPTEVVPDPCRPVKDGARLLYLDGLRGLAAAQVVLRHYMAAFLPGLGMCNAELIHYKWELAGFKAPWFILSDGHFWMCLFFVISGAVLTVAHNKNPLRLGPALAQRIVRLGGAMAFALAFSAVLLSVAPRVHSEAAVLSGSNLWLGTLMSVASSLPEIVHQTLSSGMVLGYREASLLPQGAAEALALDPLARSLDPPLWTLHIEFWGSALVLSLVSLRRRLSRRSYATLAVLVTILLSRHVFLAFLVGHFFALVLETRPWESFRRSRFAAVAGFAGLALGIFSCTNPRWGWMTVWLELPVILPTHVLIRSQSLYAAILFFIGVALFAPMKSVLLCFPIQWLGRNSFGLYLFHFPILFTVSSSVFVALHSRTSYGGAILGAAAIGVPTSLAAAAVFTAWINRPFVRFGRALAKIRPRRTHLGEWTGRVS